MFLIGEYRPRLGTVLLVSNLFLILLFLAAGLLYFRYFERNIVQTIETRLMSQGALMAVYYRIAFKDEREKSGPSACRDNWNLEAYPEATRYQGRRQWDRYYGTAQPGLKPFKSIPKPSLLFVEHDNVSQRGKAADACALSVGQAIQPYLSDMERAASISAPAEIFLIDRSGIVVAATLDGMYLSIDIDDHEILKQVFQGEPIAALHESRKAPDALMKWGRRLQVTHGKAIEVVVGFPIILDNRVMGAVVSRQTPGSFLDGYRNNRGGVMHFAALFLILWTIFTWWLMRFSIDRPIRAVMAQLRDSKDHSLSETQSRSRSVTRDVKDIYQEVTGLLKARDRRDEDTKNLANLLAHRVREIVTPVEGAIDLVRNHPDVMSPEEVDRHLVMVKKKMQQLESLSKQLTILARYEMPIADGDHVGIDDLLDQWNTERMNDRYRFIVQPEAHGLYIAMRKEWLDTIVSSLVENAYQHGGVNIEVMVTVDLDSKQQGFIRIKVHDNGPGIPTANIHKIFDPFFTTSRDSGSHGFGLTGVKKLVERHGGRIDLIPSESGATFQILLPSYMLPT